MWSRFEPGRGLGEDGEVCSSIAVRGVEISAGEQSGRPDFELPDAVFGVAVWIPGQQRTGGGVERHELVAANGIGVVVAFDVAVRRERRVVGAVEEELVLDVDEVSVPAGPDGVRSCGDGLEVARSESLPDLGARGRIEGDEGVAAATERAAARGVDEIAARPDGDFVDGVGVGGGPAGVDYAGVLVDAADVGDGGAVDLGVGAGDVEVTAVDDVVEHRTRGSRWPRGDVGGEARVDGAGRGVDLRVACRGDAVERGESAADPRARTIERDRFDGGIGVGDEAGVDGAGDGVELDDTEAVESVNLREASDRIHGASVGRDGEVEDLRGSCRVGQLRRPVGVQLSGGDVDRGDPRLGDAVDFLEVATDVVTAVGFGDGPHGRLGRVVGIVGRVDCGDAEDVGWGVVGAGCCRNAEPDADGEQCRDRESSALAEVLHHCFLPCVCADGHRTWSNGSLANTEAYSPDR